MTLKEMKIKTFSLIEEYYPEKETLADDQDVNYKINGVINSIMLDLMKYRPIIDKYSITVTETNESLAFSSIPNFYQLDSILDVDYKIIANYEIVFNFDEETLPKTVDIYYYKYPELMELEFEATETQTKDQVSAEYDESFEFEQDPDILEIMPYGIAADLLKMDMISNYGSYFYQRYTELKQMIDSRKTKGIITIDGGVDI